MFQPGTGLLASQTLGNASKAFAYDSAARPTAVTTTLDNTDYTVTTRYDGKYGRPKALVYPNNLTLAYEYNGRGYLTQEKNAQSGYVYRHITAQDVWGNISSAKLTNNTLTGTYSYSSRSGQMLSICINSCNSNGLQYLDYKDYDSYGNLKEYTNHITGFTDTYAYDKLHRLTQSSTAGNNFSHSIDYAYDSVGNLTKKTDYSRNANNAYTYVPNTNQVQRIKLKNGTEVSFGYDNTGNQTKRNNQQEVWYNRFNKPTAITRLNSQVNLYYGADLMRYKQVRKVNNQTITTYYIDKVFEVEKAHNQTTKRTYLSDIAILEESPSDTTIHFTHRDRLGSSTTFTDHNGQITAYRSYDPFGKPRMGDGSLMSRYNLPARLANNLSDTDQATRRGFTDHEHLDEVEFIHMNGRVYDYNQGRFLSVDPLIQGVGNSQGINPYSYILNNPLAGTDPSGYDPRTVSERGLAALTWSGVNDEMARANALGEAAIGNVYAPDDVEAIIATRDSLGDAIENIRNDMPVMQALEGAATATAMMLAKNRKGKGNGAESNNSSTKPESSTEINSEQKKAKTDFIVSSKGTAMKTDKDYNLVDSEKKNGDFLQIHNSHTDGKVDGNPHTHYPKQHDKNRTREIKSTDGADLDKADAGLKSGKMRQRHNRGDKGGNYNKEVTVGSRLARKTSKSSRKDEDNN